MRGSHPTCKVSNNCLNVSEQVEMVDRNKDGPSHSLMSYKPSVSVKENHF